MSLGTLQLLTFAGLLGMKTAMTNRIQFEVDTVLCPTSKVCEVL